MFQSLGRDSGCSSHLIKAHGDALESFQSLGRDSGCSSAPRRAEAADGRRFQSLGRDSGCSSVDAVAEKFQAWAVSIPRSGFWVFKHGFPAQGGRRVCCFNPSVGILGVQAAVARILREIKRRVSIPRSGFWVFKLSW